jgi:hypothetical protein
MAGPIALSMAGMEAVLTATEEVTLAEISSDFRLVTKQFGLQVRVQCRLGPRGYKSLALFGRMGDDPLEFDSFWRPASWAMVLDYELAICKHVVRSSGLVA